MSATPTGGTFLATGADGGPMLLFAAETSFDPVAPDQTHRTHDPQRCDQVARRKEMGSRSGPLPSFDRHHTVKRRSTVTSAVAVATRFDTFAIAGQCLCDEKAHLPPDVCGVRVAPKKVSGKRSCLLSSPRMRRAAPRSPTAELHEPHSYSRARPASREVQRGHQKIPLPISTSGSS